jgi:hypothetical protein
MFKHLLAFILSLATGHAAARDCSAFDKAGEMVEVVIADSGIKPDPGRQNVDVRIRFPVDYLEYPWETSSGTRQDAELFRLKLDGSAIPWRERRGKTLDQLPPIAAVLVKGGPSFGWWLDDYIAKVTLNETVHMTPSTLRTVPSEFEGLRKISSRDWRVLGYYDHFVSVSADRFDDQFFCFPDKPGRTAQCTFWFQYRSLFVVGDYSKSYLGNWRKIKSIVTNFLDCIYLEDLGSST